MELKKKIEEVLIGLIEIKCKLAKLNKNTLNKYDMLSNIDGAIDNVLILKYYAHDNNFIENKNN